MPRVANSPAMSPSSAHSTSRSPAFEIFLERIPNPDHVTAFIKTLKHLPFIYATLANQPILALAVTRAEMHIHLSRHTPNPHRTIAHSVLEDHKEKLYERLKRYATKCYSHHHGCPRPSSRRTHERLPPHLEALIEEVYLLPETRFVEVWDPRTHNGVQYISRDLPLFGNAEDTCLLLQGHRPTYRTIIEGPSPNPEDYDYYVDYESGNWTLDTEEGRHIFDPTTWEEVDEEEPPTLPPLTTSSNDDLSRISRLWDDAYPDMAWSSFRARSQ